MADPISSPEAFVDDALESLPARRPCVVCRNKPLSRALVYFMAAKAKEDERAMVSLTWFYNNKLAGQFKGPHVRTARDHVTRCLGLDLDTGLLRE